MEKDDITIEPLFRGMSLSTLSFRKERNEGYNVSIACYRANRGDCSVQGVLLNYEKCTPKKTEEQMQYNGSPMEVEYFENTVVAKSATLKDEFPTVTKTDSKTKRNSSRKGPGKSGKHLLCKNEEGFVSQRKIGIIITTIVLSVLLHLLFYQHATSDTCDCEVDIERLHKNLLEEVYNQTECIDAMISSLQNRNRWPKRKRVVAFTGGVGVGKTFIINIAKKHFPKEGTFEIVHIDQKVKFNFHPIICCNLIIMDNLIAANIDSAIKLLNSLPDTTYALVVVAFNVQKTDYDLNYFYDQETVDTINQKFATSSLYYETCSFNTLDKLTALSWLKKEYTKRKISETLQKNITDYVLANSNITASGFKRLSQKVSLAAEIFNVD